MLPSILLWQLDSLPLNFFWWRADGGLIDQEVVKQAHIPLKKLPKPKTILDLDGKNLTRVTTLTINF